VVEVNLYEEITLAAERIAPHIHKTALFHSMELSAMNGGAVYLKLESEQYTGSFKVRGALNKVLSMSPEEKAPGLITASTGNHGLGFAHALAVSGDRGEIYLPVHAVESKVAALRNYDVELVFHGNSCLEAELRGKEIAGERGMVWVSPYNDHMVIAGQGTIGREILDRVPDVDAVLVCVGGGGLIGGIASWIKEVQPEADVIGCLPENAPEMYLSVQKGEVVILDDPPATLSDGSAGGLEVDSVTFDLCRKIVDDYILVPEQEIADAVRWMVNTHHKIIEGSAGVALASFINHTERFQGKKVAIVICGANIPTEKLKALL
jgi:threonine dehydratase